MHLRSHPSLWVLFLSLLAVRGVMSLEQGTSLTAQIMGSEKRDHYIHSVSSPIQVLKGSPVIISVTVGNRGPSDDWNTELNWRTGLHPTLNDQTFPMDSDNTDVECRPVSGTYTSCKGVQLPANGLKTLRLAFRTDTAPCNAVFSIGLMVRGKPGETFLLDNESARYLTQVICSPMPPGSHDLRLALDPVPYVTRGQITTYTARLRNAGSTQADNVLLRLYDGQHVWPSLRGVFVREVSSAECTDTGDGAECRGITLAPNEEKILRIGMRAPDQILCDKPFVTIVGMTSAYAERNYVNNWASVRPAGSCPPPGTPACSDGRDNDADRATDWEEGDWSCSGPQDTDESDPVPECNNGIDDDFDGKTDFPRGTQPHLYDQGCGGIQDPKEIDPDKDLMLTKLEGPQQVVRGQTAVFRATIKNLSNMSLPFVSVRHGDFAILPINGRVVFPLDPAQSSVTCNEIRMISCANMSCMPYKTKDCGNVTLPPQGEATFTLAFRVPPDAACPQRLSFTAGAPMEPANYAWGDMQPINNAKSIEMTVACSQVNPAQSADLTLAFGPPVGRPYVNGLYREPLSVKNAGPLTATNVVLTDDIPKKATFVPAASDARCRVEGKNVVCTIASIAPGVTENVTISYDYGSSASICTDASVWNTMTVQANEPDPRQQDNAIYSYTSNCDPPGNATVVPSLQGPTLIAPGQKGVFTLRIENQGPADITNAEAIVVGPPASGPVAVLLTETDSRCAFDVSGRLLCKVPSIPAGQSAAFSITLRVIPTAACGIRIMAGLLYRYTITVINSTTYGWYERSNLVETGSPPCQSGSSRSSAASSISSSAGPTPGKPECSDNYDNDRDVNIDFPSDPGCDSPEDPQEGGLFVCNDGIDNDGDGRIDVLRMNNFGSYDPGCLGSKDPSEKDAMEDLTISSLFIPTQVARGETLLVEATVKNKTANSLSEVSVNHGNFAILPALPLRPPVIFPQDTTLSTEICRPERMVYCSNLRCGAGTSNVCGSFNLGPNAEKKVALAFRIPPDAACPQTLSFGVGAPIEPPSYAWMDMQTWDNGKSGQFSVTCAPVDPSQSADLVLAFDAPMYRPYTVGGTYRYTLWVKNKGPLIATNVKVVDNIPLNNVFSPNLSDPRCRVVGTDVVCESTSLAPNATTSFRIAFTPQGGSSCWQAAVSNQMVATSDQPDSNIADNQILAHTTDCSSPDFTRIEPSLTGPSVIAPGQKGVLTLQLQNDGPGLATDVQAMLIGVQKNDAMLTIIPAETDSRCTFDATNRLVCKITQLDDGQTDSFKITLQSYVGAFCDLRRDIGLMYKYTVTASTPKTYGWYERSRLVNTGTQPCPPSSASSSAESQASSESSAASSVPSALSSSSRMSEMQSSRSSGQGGGGAGQGGGGGKQCIPGRQCRLCLLPTLCRQVDCGIALCKRTCGKICHPL